MRPFMGEDFLLESETARVLYHKFASAMPILDYHCHLSPEEIAKNRRFSNIAEVWLASDHYKWRLMRANGVEEAYITGDAPDREKFRRWTMTLEKAIGNPIYHWSHLELQRYFDYHGVLNADTADEVWQHCNERLQEPGMDARSLIVKSGVTLLCTTDDPADDLRWHRMLREDDTFPVQVLPAFRPEAAMKITDFGFADYMERLGAAAGVAVTDFASLKEALVRRLIFFDSMGCAASDHSSDYAMYEPAKEAEIEEIFGRALSKKPISRTDELKYQTAILLFLAGEYKKLGFVMQLHFGVKRDCDRGRAGKLGPDTGFDCIDTHTPSASLAELLNAMAEGGGLPKTVLYSLNPADNAAIGTVIGCFQDSTCPGKIQQGSAWWFNDSRQGMTDQMTSLANLGLLANFIGMLTDSRSFLSYTRHEYFRRILCSLMGRWVENGEYPWDEERLGGMVKDIAYRNAVRYFGFDLEMPE